MAAPVVVQSIPAAHHRQVAKQVACDQQGIAACICFEVGSEEYVHGKCAVLNKISVRLL